MKNYILQFTQEYAIKNNLDIVDLHILDYMLKWFGSGFAVQRRLDNKGTVQDDMYYLFSQNKLIQDMPILNLQIRAVQKRFKKYKELGIIQTKLDHQRLYINFTNIFDFM